MSQASLPPPGGAVSTPSTRREDGIRSALQAIFAGVTGVEAADIRVSFTSSILHVTGDVTLSALTAGCMLVSVRHRHRRRWHRLGDHHGRETTQRPRSL